MNSEHYLRLLPEELQHVLFTGFPHQHMNLDGNTLLPTNSTNYNSFIPHSHLAQSQQHFISSTQNHLFPSSCASFASTRPIENKKMLPEKAVQLMNSWYLDHEELPYPSEVEKERLASEGGITMQQVRAWFANKRNRCNNTRPKKQRRLRGSSNNVNETEKNEREYEKIETRKRRKSSSIESVKINEKEILEKKEKKCSNIKNRLKSLLEKPSKIFSSIKQNKKERQESSNENNKILSDPIYVNLSEKENENDQPNNNLRHNRRVSLPTTFHHENVKDESSSRPQTKRRRSLNCYYDVWNDIHRQSKQFNECHKESDDSTSDLPLNETYIIDRLVK
ncbi:hypothetical protein SNEBB_008583 [Seison nebaliae]|nr:hypothetical protein SNEBB_008583 [Seison nebaliae]